MHCACGDYKDRMHTHTAALHGRVQTILHHPRAYAPPRAADLITSYRMVYPSEVSLHPRTRTSDNHEPPFGAIAQFMDGGPWHRHDLTGRLSNQQPPFSHAIGHAF